MKKMAFIDMEGVLIPEIWKHFANYFNIPELSLTTREVADYQQLMLNRINILRTHHITLNRLTDVLKDIEPMSGAKEFLQYLERNKKFEIRIISDCFYEFLNPFLKWDFLLKMYLVDHGFLFQPSDEVKKNAPFYFHTMQSYQEVMNYLNKL